MYATTLLALAAAAITTVQAGGTTYPTCPIAKYTFASCGEDADATGGAITRYACSQMSANQKCNANTNIYNTVQCPSTDQPNWYYCEASIVESIDINTFTSYCNSYTGPYSAYLYPNAAWGSIDAYHICGQLDPFIPAPLPQNDKKKVKKNFIA